MSLPLKLQQNVVYMIWSASLWGAVACGADALPPADLNNEPDNLEAIALLSGSVQDGKLSFTSLEDGGPGVRPQGFGEFTSGLVSFVTQAGDGVGTGTCTASEYCGTVDTTNGTGRLMDNLFIEVTSYDGVTPAGAAVKLVNPITASGAYTGFFVNSAAPEAATYGSFTIGQTKSVEWKFNLAAGSPQADNFNFQAAVYASFRRSAVSGAFQTGRPAINACGMAGAVMHVVGADDAEENFELAFPYTSLDITYDRAVVSSNGYLLLYQTGGAVPTESFTNGPLTNLRKVGFYPFWDDLAFDAADGVCVAVSGTKPSRVITVTWANAKINAAQPAKGTWTTEKITYSLVLHETTDRFFFHYDAPSGGVTDLTRGLSATLGFRAIRSGTPYNANYGTNKINPYLPALASSYGTNIVGAPGPINP